MVNKDDALFIDRNSNVWFCTVCNKAIFPFNTIDEDNAFMEAIYDLRCTDIPLPFDILSSSGKIFSPFELNEDLIEIPLIENDPDVQY